MQRLRSTIKFNLYLLLILAAVFLYGTCSFDGFFERAEELVEDITRPKTPREKFAGDYEWAALEPELAELAEEAWTISFELADTQRLTITLPHREVLTLNREDSLSTQAFRFQLPAGRVISIRAEADSTKIFGELYRVGTDGRRTGYPVATWEAGNRELTYEPSRGNELLIFLLQSEPGTRDRALGPVELSFTTRAALVFPVAGKDERAIKSFWGDSRSGGRRRHKGNDIFAPKGAPLLAVADGRVTKVANGGLGGKTVWLRDQSRGQSYYYAHLDSQYVRRGQYVRAGDTLGTVGNTGNARTTPPHLHFGVYARGAYDPFTLLKNDDTAPPAPQYKLPKDPTALSVPKRGSHYLRSTPQRGGTVLRQLTNEEPVIGLGATGRFYRVLTREGEYGYVNFD